MKKNTIQIILLVFSTTPYFFQITLRIVDTVIRDKWAYRIFFGKTDAETSTDLRKNAEDDFTSTQLATMLAGKQTPGRVTVKTEPR
jgi:hypothetical protein